MGKRFFLSGKRKKPPSKKSKFFMLNPEGELEIVIFNDIDKFFGFSSQDLIDQLSETDENTSLRIRINSMGGEAFEGLAMYNVLRAWKGEVTAVNEGVVASAATLPYLAADKRIMHESSMIMIHNPATMAFGDADEVEDVVKTLRLLEDQVISIYESRTNASEAQLKEWLKGDKWFTSQEALDNGFASELAEVHDVAAKANLESIVLKLAESDRETFNNLILKMKKDKTMGFEVWLKAYCEPLGIDPSDLSDDQRTTLKAKYDKEIKSGPTPPPIPKRKEGDDDDDLKKQRKNRALEMKRANAIESLSSRHTATKLNAEYLKDELGLENVSTVPQMAAYAIEEGWTADRFELELRRSERKDVGQFAIHNAPSQKELNVPAMSAALAREAGVPASQKHKWSGNEYGYEHFYDEKTLDASDRYKNLGLQQILNMAIVEANGSPYEGRLGTDGFISACRDALWKIRMSGNTTWAGLNIFDDAANKMLWASYESQNTTWQEWVKQMSVNDFKTHNTYRLTSKGAYQQVGADGELKHGGFTDDKYTHSADTYGKIVGLTRRDIINDDLGALNNIMGMLGEEGAKFLEELYYQHLMGQLTTLFPTDDSNSNYISGAATDLGVDGLTTAEQKGADQVDGDNSPILVPLEILLVGTQDAVVAAELNTLTALTGLQTANQKKRPDQNPHVGKFRPVVSGFLNNTAIKQRITNVGQAISNQTSDQWLLLRSPSPSGGIVIGSFLNGQTRPTIESGDASFEVLGLQWRAYHDAGADDGDPKWGVYSKGAA